MDKKLFKIISDETTDKKYIISRMKIRRQFITEKEAVGC